VYSIIFDMADVFMCGSIVDAFVNMIMDILAREASSEIVAFCLIDFLVVVVPWPISTMFAAGVPTTAIMMGLFVVVVVVVLLLKSIWQVIVVMPAWSW